MVYTLRFFYNSKRSLFHNSNMFGSCIIHILYTGVLKLKKKNSGSKRLTTVIFSSQLHEVTFATRLRYIYSN